MNSRIRNRLYGTFFRNPEEPTPAPGASDVIEEEELGSERLLALSARLRKKERELEDLRIELAEWERLLSAREDYLRTCEANVARPGGGGGRPTLLGTAGSSAHPAAARSQRTRAVGGATACASSLPGGFPRLLTALQSGGMNGNGCGGDWIRCSGATPLTSLTDGDPVPRDLPRLVGAPRALLAPPPSWLKVRRGQCVGMVSHYRDFEPDKPLDIAQIKTFIRITKSDGQNPRPPPAPSGQYGGHRIPVRSGYRKLMTRDTPFTSMPRAAISVATSTRTFPERKSSNARSRAVCDLLPWMALAAIRF